MVLTKTGKTTLYAIASTALSDITVGSWLDVSTYYGGTVRFRVGRPTATSWTAQPQIRIEAGFDVAPATDDAGLLAGPYSPALGVSVASSAVSGTAAAAATSVTLTSGTGFAAGDLVFFHNTVLANSEWRRVKSVAGAILTLEDGLTFAQTGSTARNQAEEFMDIYLDLASGIKALRVVVRNEANSAAAVIVAADIGGVTVL